MKRAGGKAPRFVAPQLATLVDEPPEGDDWLHEIKYDGYRTMAGIGGGRVRIYTRKGLDWTARFSALVEPLRNLPCRSALLDGEIAVADRKGRTSFSALQQALSGKKDGFTFYLFDLLHLDGTDLRPRPLLERKEALRKLLARAGKRGPLIYSDHIRGKGTEAFRQSCKQGLEGIVSKRADAPYRSARTRSWLKTKCGMEQELVIVGWSPSTKRGRPFSSILLGFYEKGELQYAGRVGSGFNDDQLDELAAKFAAHARKTNPAKGVPAAVARKAQFLDPKLVGEFALRGWTGDGLVRQGSFKGLRIDKPAREVVREIPVAGGRK